MGVSRLCVLFGAMFWRRCENDWRARDDAGIWRDECGRAVPFSVLSAGRTGRMVQGVFWEATMELGSQGVMATCWTRCESGVSPFVAALVSDFPRTLITNSALHIPALLLLDPGNRSLNKSSDSTPTSPLMRSSSSNRAEIGGRSRRLLRRFLCA